MKKLLIILLFIVFSTNAQIGINTIYPKAMLDIQATDANNPASTDGLIIPRITNFPAINPGADQNGMLVFLNATVGSNTPPGFYYWDNNTTSWIKIIDNETLKINDLLDGKSDIQFTSVYLGKNAGSFNPPIETRENTSVGFETMKSGTHVKSVAVGYKALTNGGGNFNIAVGHMAMSNTNNITGCIAIGKNSLQNASGVTGNVGIGQNSLLNTAGNDNIAVGNETLKNNTSGTSNVAIGIESLLNNKQGNDNIAIGKRALYSNTTTASNLSGFSNISIGTQSLYNNTYGSNNLAIGYRSLYQNNGGLNIAIGTQALENSNGNKNIAIGNLAGNNLTSGNNNIIIGNNIDFPVGNISNQLNISNIIYGINIDGVNNTVSTGNIGIGVKNPVEKLEVAGGIKIGNTNNTNTGTIRWNGSDFEGYNGTSWVSFTTGNYWKLNGNAGTNPIENFIGTTDNIDFVFRTNDIEKMRLTTSGDLKLITSTTNSAILRNGNNYSHTFDNNIDFAQGATNNSWMLASRETTNANSGVYGNPDYISMWASGSYNNILIRFLVEEAWFDDNGNPYDNNAEVAYIDGNGQYIQGSDKNRKQNIERIKNPVETLKKINGYTYKFKSGGKKTAGVIAQEVYKVFPQAVKKSENNEYFVHYAGLVPLLIESVKKQQSDIDNLEKQINEIVRELKKQLNNLTKNK